MLKEIEEIYGRGMLSKPKSTAKVIEVFSSQNSIGKTALALHRASIVQKKGGTVLYIDSDNTLCYDYAIKCGIDPSKLLVSYENSAPHVFNLIKNLARENKVSLVILDTITALIFFDRFGEGFTELVGLILKSNMDIMVLHQIRLHYENRSNLRSLIQIYIDREKTFRNMDGMTIEYRNRITVKKGNLLLQNYIFEVNNTKIVTKAL